jgi:hypothetical protein
MSEHTLADGETPDAEESFDRDLERMLRAPVAGERSGTPSRVDGVRVGTLVGFADSGAVPLVTYPGQPGTAALRARATLDLHAAHIGRSAVMMFEDGEPTRPIVVGCLQGGESRGAPAVSGQVDVEADGERLVLSARDRIVLRCGKASITLTREGKLILQGEYVSNQASGVLRLKGGSVQIN